MAFFKRKDIGHIEGWGGNKKGRICSIRKNN